MESIKQKKDKLRLKALRWILDTIQFAAFITLNQPQAALDRKNRWHNTPSIKGASSWLNSCTAGRTFFRGFIQPCFLRQ
jgi:hypothetical protein